MVMLCIEKFSVHEVGRLDREMQNLEKRQLLILWKFLHDPLCLFRNLRIELQPLLCRSILEGEIGIMQSVILLRVPFKLKSHVFGFTLPCQSIIFVKYMLQTFLVFRSENRRQPFRLIRIDILYIECRHIPRQIEERLHAQFHRLDVTDIEQPVAVCSRLVCLHQLLVHKNGRCGVYPKIVVRCAEITEMIIYSATAFSVSLSLIAHALHVSVVVVRPYNRDVLGDIKSSIIDVECLFVRYKNLRNVRDILLFIFCEDFPLVLEHLLECPGPDSRVGGSFHCLVVESTHSHRVDIVVLRSLPNSVVEFVIDRLLIRQVVPFAVPFFCPFRRSCVVE